MNDAVYDAMSELKKEIRKRIKEYQVQIRVQEELQKANAVKTPRRNILILKTRIKECKAICKEMIEREIFYAI